MKEKIELTDIEIIELVEKSYITKEKLIEMINALDFKQVKDLRMEVITGYQIKYDKDNEKYVSTLGYDIHID